MRSSLTLLLAGILCVPIWAQAGANASPPGAPGAGQATAGPVASAPVGSVPVVGTLNYVEGQATLNGQTVTEKSVGKDRLAAGQTLATQTGRAELLLTPGVMLRLDDSSAVLMDNPGIADTEVAITGGRAMVEADQVLPANHIVIHMGPASVRVMTHGLYDIDSTHAMVRVFDGRAKVTIGGKSYTVQHGHDFELNAAKLKARGFNKSANEDAFYRWASLRSSYLAEANVDAARGYAQGGYASPYYYSAYAAYGYGPGWFWDPYFDAYTWLPYDGIYFNPFGFGFYSPAFVYAAPFYGGRFGFRGGDHHFGPGYRPSVAPRMGGSTHIAAGGGFRSGGVRGMSGGVRGGFSGGAARGGFRGGGGFHGGGGGFHGGGGRR